MHGRLDFTRQQRLDTSSQNVVDGSNFAQDLHALCLTRFPVVLINREKISRPGNNFISTTVTSVFGRDSWENVAKIYWAHSLPTKASPVHPSSGDAFPVSPWSTNAVIMVATRQAPVRRSAAAAFTEYPSRWVWDGHHTALSLPVSMYYALVNSCPLTLYAPTGCNFDRDLIRTNSRCLEQVKFWVRRHCTFSRSVT